MADGRAPRSRATSTRTQGRSRSRPAPLDQVFSVPHIDDYSAYHTENDARSEVVTDESEDEGHVLDREKPETDTDEDSPENGEDTRDSKDLEAGKYQLEKKTTTRSARDPNLVTWEGPDDPLNPLNWAFKRKWAATFVISSFTFISPVSSSMVAPSLPAIASRFHIDNEVESQLVLSIFVLAYAIGPLIIGPLSEMYGRVKVLQLTNLIYLVFNIGCGFAQTKGQMLVFRLLSGLGGSAPLAIGGGLIADLFAPEERGRAISIYSLAPLLGPAIGPIAGGFITEKTTWRWTFWATSIADVAIQCSGLIFLQETYGPQLLHQKAKRLRKETGNPNLKTEYEHPEHSLANKLQRSLIRPFRLLATQPIVQALACYMAFIYGLMYLVLSTFPVLWTQHYHENLGVSGLNYISMAVGFTAGAQICAPLNDRVYRRLRASLGHGVGRPEFRIPMLLVTCLFLPTGLFLYGWSAERHFHWIVPNIGAAIMSCGVIVAFQCIQTYVVDAYTRYAASAIGAVTVLRSLAGFGFPLFAPTMYNNLGYGWGNSLLGFVALGIGIPAPILLWFYGEALRKKSKFAAGGF